MTGKILGIVILVCALVAGAAIPSERGDLGLRVQAHGKHYFTDKTPFTALEQLERAKQSVAQTGLKWYVYFSERLHVEGAVMAGKLIDEGRIGRVLQVVNLAPHRLNKPSRPAWFFKRAQYGGILCDIGSHQIEQFLFFCGAQDATVTHAAVANYNNPQYPELEDFGEANLVADNGCANYFRVDWFTPDGLPTWGDGRLFVLGTEGYIELRKYIDIAGRPGGEHLFLVDQKGIQYINCQDVPLPYASQLIDDILNRTETAMTQAHCFLAMELALKAEAMAERIGYLEI